MFKKLLRKLTGEENIQLESVLSKMGGSFASEEEANTHFQSEIKHRNQLLEKLKSEFPEVNLDNKAKSLIEFEQLYYDIFKQKKEKCSFSKSDFEMLMTHYVRELFIKNEMAEYAVESFQEGNYILGIRYGYGSWTNDHYAENLQQQKRKNRDYLYRYFMDFVPEEFEDNV